MTPEEREERDYDRMVKAKRKEMIKFFAGSAWGVPETGWPCATLKNAVGSFVIELNFNKASKCQWSFRLLDVSYGLIKHQRQDRLKAAFTDFMEQYAWRFVNEFGEIPKPSTSGTASLRHAENAVIRWVARDIAPARRHMRGFFSKTTAKPSLDGVPSVSFEINGGTLSIKVGFLSLGRIGYLASDSTSDAKFERQHTLSQAYRDLLNQTDRVTRKGNNVVPLPAGGLDYLGTVVEGRRRPTSRK